MSQTGLMPIQPGDHAPDFAVPAVQDDRTIGLADYRGKTPLLLGLFPGMYCPFCRRALVQMATTSDHLRTLGVDSLAIVGTELNNARLYFKFRPTRMTLGVDPQLTTHRSVRRAATGADAGDDADPAKHFHQSNRRASGPAAGASGRARACRARRLSKHAD